MPLDEKSPIPLYYQLKQILEENIKNGVWSPGDLVPAERTLAQEYAVSLGTARQALQALMQEGLVVRKRGRGTFVARSKLMLGTHFLRQLRAQGFAVRTRLISARIAEPTPRGIAELFNLESTAPVYIIMRVRLVNEEPLALETLYIPAHLAPDLLAQDLVNLAVLPFIQKKYVEKIQKEFRNTKSTSTVTVEPVLLNEFEATLLGQAPGAPALLVERTGFFGNVPLGLQKRVIRGDRCKLFLVGDDTNEAGAFQLQIRHSPVSSSSIPLNP